jgi:hypothetical protein
MRQVLLLIVDGAKGADATLRLQEALIVARGREGVI